MRAKTINLLFVTLFIVNAFHGTSTFADELEYSRIANDLEQKILIKSDVIEAVRTGVLQLQRACDLETNKLNDASKIENPLVKEIKSDFTDSEVFREKTQNTLVSSRTNALQTYRNNCSLLGQIIGSDETNKNMCKKAKGTIEFIDRLIPSLNKSMELEKLRSVTLNTLLKIEQLQCTSPMFSQKIYKEFQSVIEPLNDSIVDEFVRASKLIE